MALFSRKDGEFRRSDAREAGSACRVNETAAAVGPVRIGRNVQIYRRALNGAG